MTNRTTVIVLVVAGVLGMVFLACLGILGLPFFIFALKYGARAPGIRPL